jgi:hypothetical protein
MSSSTTWPEGVIARYATVGGATVDIRHAIDRVIGEPFADVADCGGCGARFIRDWERPLPGTPNIRVWAQSHAEKCRAVPKPNA